MKLKDQLEEARSTKEVVKIQLKKKEENYQDLEYVIVSLGKELEKTIVKLNISLKFEKSNEILDDIIIFQIFPFIKVGIGYDVVVSSLPTIVPTTTKEVLFFASGVYTSFLEEKPIVPHMA